jgi:hypothetical protein
LATLTQTAYTTRKIIKYGGLGLFGFLIFRGLLLTAIAYYHKLYPPPPPPPTVAFGKLEKIPFPEKPQPTLSYKLELPTKEFPEFPDRAKVFLIPYKRATFDIWDQAKAEAAKLGFNGEPQAITSQVYRWTKKTPVITTLEMDIINGSFEYEYDWQEDPTILEGGNPPGKEQAINEARAFASKAVNIGEDVLNGEAKVIYIKVTGNKLIPVISLSEADFVQVDLFRANIDNLPVMTANPSQGIISTLISGSSKQRILKLIFNYFPVNYTNPATYPIKTPSEAWQELINGRGYIAACKEGIQEVTVRRVYLGYYENYEPQTYLQPIYFFTGDNDFIGYVPAVTAEYYPQE